MEQTETDCPCPIESASSTRVKKPFSPFTYEEPKSPQLMINQNFTCADVFLWKRENIDSKFPTEWSAIARKLGFSMLNDVRSMCMIDFKFTNFQTMAAIEVFFRTFTYFVNSKVANASELIEFFQEQILLYAVEHPPKSFDVFSTKDAYALITYFSEIFLKHAVLLRAVTGENVIISIQVDKPKVIAKKKKK